MKKIILLFLSFGVVSCGQVKQQVSEQARVNVMSYNIRYDNPEDGMNNWQYRKDRAATAIRFYDVDILGTQEVLHNQLEDLKQRLPEYGVIGVGREDGKVKAAQGQHLVQCAQLAHLAHRLRAEGHVGKARLIQCFHGTAHGVQRFFKGRFPALLAAAAGMEDDAFSAQRPAHRRALQQVLDAVQPLVLFQAGHADVIGRVHTEQDVLRGGKGGHLRGLVQSQAHPAPALVLKGVQAHLCGVLRHLQAGLVPLGGKAVAGAGRAEPDLPIVAHRVFPPRS